MYLYSMQTKLSQNSMSGLIDLMDKWLGIVPVISHDEIVEIGKRDLSNEKSIVYTSFKNVPDKFELNCKRCSKLLSVFNEHHCLHYNDFCSKALLECDGRR